MKRIFLFLAAAFFLVPALAFAQMARVIDLKGDVQIKQGVSSDWGRAKMNMLLGKDAEIKTAPGSHCTLAFDEERKNIMTIKENSQIRIENVTPGSVYLPQGRVFSLINNLSRNEKFQVRTPTAIAGARGTGWGTQTDGTNTGASCFEDTIFVQGLDEQGNPTGEQDVGEGFGLDIFQGGLFGDMSPLGDGERGEWNDFSNYVGGLGGGGSQPQGDDLGEGDLGAGLDEFKGESRDEFGQNLDELRRLEEENKQEETSSPTGNEV